MSETKAEMLSLVTEARPRHWKFQPRQGTTAPRAGLETEATSLALAVKDNGRISSA